MILLLSGTRDGRILAQKLHNSRHEVLATTVSEYGELLLKEGFSGEVLSKPLAKDDMRSIISNREINMVVDATHPFAVNASQNAMEVCKESGIEYVRYERESCEHIDSEKIVPVKDVTEAVSKAASFEGNVFLTIGSNHLEQFVEGIGTDRIIARVLPTSQVLKKCEALGLQARNIIAMQGPFSTKINIEMFKHYHTKVVVTKESGSIGGFKEKIDACRSLDVPIIVIGRPALEYNRVFSDMEELLRYIKTVVTEE